MAVQHGARILHETTVGAGLPVMDSYAKLVETGDKVLRVEGCTSGTLGFLLPAVATALLTNGLDGSLPSVMCHYALALALFLARIVARERALAEEHQTSDRPLAA